MSLQPVKSAERTIRVLELFQRQQQPQTLHQVATQLRMPVPSTLAILRTLVGMGYLILDVRRKTYFPALRLASLGDWVSAQFFENSPVLEGRRALARGDLRAGARHDAERSARPLRPRPARRRCKGLRLAARREFGLGPGAARHDGRQLDRPDLPAHQHQLPGGRAIHRARQDHRRRAQVRPAGLRHADRRSASEPHVPLHADAADALRQAVCDQHRRQPDSA